MQDSELGLTYTDAEIDAILGSESTPPSIKAALAAGQTLKRLKADSIYSTQRFALGGGGGTALAAGTFAMFSVRVGGTGQGFPAAQTHSYAQTNLQTAGENPFNVLFVARRLEIIIYSNDTAATNNQADEAVDAIVHGSAFQLLKGTSFVWNVGPVKFAVSYPGNKIYSVLSGAVGYGLGNGMNLRVPFVLGPKENFSANLVVDPVANYNLTLPAAYTVDVLARLEGDAIELVSQ